MRKLRNPDFVKLIQTYDLICFAETKLDEYDIDSVDVPGFTLLPPLNRSNCKSRYGGIAVIARNAFCKYVKAINNP